MIFSQMACKQIGLNILEYVKPLLTIKPKINKITNQFKDVINDYSSNYKVENKMIKKVS